LIELKHYGKLPERAAYHSLGQLLEAILGLGAELNGKMLAYC
jgi:hypothetical protein